MRKLIFSLMWFFLMGTLGVGQVAMAAAAPPFSDVPVTHPSMEAIGYMYDSGIIAGYEDGTFRPENEINRAEFLKILVEASNADPSVAVFHDCFTDVTDQWFARYVCFAKSINWVGGYPDGSYLPAQTVNKVEAIKMVLNSQDILGIPDPLDLDVQPYNDVPVDAWFSGYVTRAKELNVLGTAGPNLYPADNMTRADICELTYRVRLYNESMDNLEDMTFDDKPFVSEDTVAVQRVIDGDTIEVYLNGVKEKVRFLGIDTPELSSDDCYSTEAKDYLSGLVFGKTVILKGDTLNEDRDAYGRLLRYVLMDGIDINKKMIIEGYAHYYDTYRIDLEVEYEAAEDYAKELNAGLWGECFTVHEAANGIVISAVFYDGVVSRVESDEYVEVRNNGTEPVNIEGYKIGGSKGDDFFVFPKLLLGVTDSVKVYTNQGDYNFGSSYAIWNNSGETAYLWDDNGVLISEFGY